MASPDPIRRSSPPRLATELPRRLEAGASARRQLELCFGGVIPDATLCRALTVVSELVNNAVLHGEGRIELIAEAGEGVLRVEVVDEGSGEALGIREQEPDAIGGWGLRLVDDLCVSWGAYEGSTHVWADLSLD